MQEIEKRCLIVDDDGNIVGSEDKREEAEHLAVTLIDRELSAGRRVSLHIEEGERMYVTPNFKTKKALKEALEKGEKVSVFQPNGDLFGSKPTANGTVAVEGPHYPEPHRWYARLQVTDGVVTKVLS